MVLCGNLSNVSTNVAFFCPREGESEDWTACCGEGTILQYCCIPHSSNVKWGITIGIVGGVLLLMLVGYAVQLFRVCEMCYPDCPIECFREDQKQFDWETKWYTVSHEGNRYGVTFHNRRFAKYFMRALEERYGPWNTANILKIKREEEEYVVLSIFFHEHFTPWFYTQGPIKHDEEWIKTDFREMCELVKEHLSKRNCCHIFSRCRHNKDDTNENDPSHQEIINELTSLKMEEDSQEINRKGSHSKLDCLNNRSHSISSTVASIHERSNFHSRNKVSTGARSMSIQLASNESGVIQKPRPRHSLRPWTKASFRDFQIREGVSTAATISPQLFQTLNTHGSASGYESLGVSTISPRSSLTIDAQLRRCSIASPGFISGASQTQQGSPCISSQRFSSVGLANNTVIIHYIDATVESIGNNKATQTARQVRII